MSTDIKIIKGALIINDGKSVYADLMIKGDRIEKIAPNIQINTRHEEINGEDRWLIPGIIDDQVHFREPGWTHKADIASESKAAAAGGVTSFMEMPNTFPPTLSQELLQAKYDIAQRTSYTNYSFFMGASNDNYEEVMRTHPENVCGIKIFMGSSTGNMLVDDSDALEKLFANVPMLIATHCEDEQTIKRNLEFFKAKYGDALTAEMHPLIRNTLGCYTSSSMAVNLAKNHGTRLHVLHISTEKELNLFDNHKLLSQKKITSEVCVHHMYFCSQDYAEKGNLIKCNPAIKSDMDKDALLTALLDDRLDIIATDHAPHAWDEKMQPYINAPSGLPLVQHSLNIMMDFYHQGKISKEKMVEKMCHAPASCFRIKDRGYLREGMYADIVLLDPFEKWTVSKDNIYYKCGWSPLEAKEFTGKVIKTIINGKIVFDRNGSFIPCYGKRLQFYGHH